MSNIDHTHDRAAKSWVESANTPGHDFPLQNLPFSVFRRIESNEAFRGGVAIGDQIVDLAAVAQMGNLEGLAQEAASACAQPKLNAFFEMGPPAWRALRHALFALLHQDAAAGSGAGTLSVRDVLVPQAESEYGIPASIGDYTDFYTSIHHARTISKLFTLEGNLPPNFQWIPTAYHGRASSIGVSGQEVRRPHGQVIFPGETAPRFVPCERLDYELELGIFIGTGNELGDRVEMARAESHLFGICLLNDWSARDIQAWEISPLGPFQAKNFATTISPWVVTMDALAPYRLPWIRPAENPQPLSYLTCPSNSEQGAIDIELEVVIETAQMRKIGAQASPLSRTNFKHQYWSVAQMLTHHAASGCNLRSGDLLGSGTISGPLIEEAGAMIELGLAGQKPIALNNGEIRSFLNDGDAIIFTAWCEKPGYARIGFGKNHGRILPASDLSGCP